MNAKRHESRQGQPLQKCRSRQPCEPLILPHPACVGEVLDLHSTGGAGLTSNAICILEYLVIRLIQERQQYCTADSVEGRALRRVCLKSCVSGCQLPHMRQMRDAITADECFRDSRKPPEGHNGP